MDNIYFRLPNLLPKDLLQGTGITWPATDPIHPRSNLAHAESMQWFKDLGVLSDEAVVKFERYATDIESGMAYRRVSDLHIDLSSRLYSLFWMMDDVFGTLEPEPCRAQGSRIKQIMFDPRQVSSSPEIAIGRLTPLERAIKDWWTQVLNDLKPPPSALTLFLHTFNIWVDSNVDEARDRDKGRTLSFEEYMSVREISVGITPCVAWGVVMFAARNEIFQSSSLQKIISECNVLIAVANDIYSYNKEQAKGAAAVAHNIVDVILSQRNQGVQDAMDQANDFYKSKLLPTVQLYHDLPVLEDEASTAYMKECALLALEWVEGNVEFSLASYRYFGEQAGSPELRNNGAIQLWAQDVVGTDSAALM